MDKYRGVYARWGMYSVEEQEYLKYIRGRYVAVAKKEPSGSINQTLAHARAVLLGEKGHLPPRWNAALRGITFEEHVELRTMASDYYRLNMKIGVGDNKGWMPKPSTKKT